MATVTMDLTKTIGLIPGYDPCDSAGDCHFDEEAALRAIEFFPECIKHAKGTLAGKPFVLAPWQQAVVGNLFGWKRPDGTRRYRECFIYVAKKNGKTALVAGLMLFVMVSDHELGAELYSAAASRDQASLLFSHAIGMVRQEPELANRLTIYGGKGGSQQKAIVYDEEMASYKCLSADANTADGTSPSFAAIDELHRHKTPELAEVLQKSTAARAQPLVIYTSTADYNRPSLCNEKLKYARQVRDNAGDPARPGFDPAFLPVVYETAPTVDWRLPANWHAANPNLGVTFPESFLARECRKAIDTPSELNNFLRLHLNIVTDAAEAWLDMQAWQECAKDVKDPIAWRADMLARMKGCHCKMGLDLSSTNDLTCLMLYFPEDGNACLPFFWMPKDNAHKREREHRVPYSTWARQGFIEMTDGNFVDQLFVLHRALECAGEYGASELTFDRWMARQIVAECERADVKVVEFGQGMASMNPAAKRLETLVLAHNLQHGNNPVLTWMAGNTMIHRDPAGNIKPDKGKSREKIDGIVALAMCIGVSMDDVGEQPQLFWS